MRGHLVSIFLLFVFFFGGVLLARLKAVRRSRALVRCSALLLPFLLLVMGYRLGMTADSSRALATSGTMAAVFALCTAVGTCLTTGCLCLLDRRKPVPVLRPDGSTRNGMEDFQLPLILLCMVAAGFLAGMLLPDIGFSGEHLTTWLLRLLLFTIGVDMVRSGISFLSALTDRSILLLPLLTLVGSLAGGLVASWMLGMNAWKGLSVSSGFAWYSLSGALITDLGDPALGSVAFLTNMFREALAILCIPFLGPTLFARSAVGVAGATSMDVTLPLIERASGADLVPLCIAHGVLLSLTVPVLTPLFFSLG